jgi:hypothetical protein
MFASTQKYVIRIMGAALIDVGSPAPAAFK